MKLSIAKWSSTAVALAVFLPVNPAVSKAGTAACMAGPKAVYTACRAAARSATDRAAQAAALRACAANRRNQRLNCTAAARSVSRKITADTPTIICASSTEASINVNVCAGTTGAPAGFTLQWMTAADYANNLDTWYSSDDPLACGGSFSGNANLSRYNLGAGECVTVNVGELLFDNGASTTCPDALVCGTTYEIRSFAHANSSLSRSEFTENFECTTLPCEQSGRCTFTQGYWKTHNDQSTQCSTDPIGPLCIQWPSTTAAPGNWDTLGTVSYTVAQLVSIFNTPAAGNGLISLAHQLIAAKLNIANGAAPSLIASSITAADTLIDGKVVPPVGAGSLSPGATSALVSALTAYNEGATGPGHCGTE
jgi:hypothetical protein